MSAEGWRVLVTGGSRGIGRAIASALAAQGARLALVARGREPLARLATETGGTAFAADLSRPEEVLRLAEAVRAHFGDAPDVVVNAAGAFGLAPIARTSSAAFDEMLATNLRAPFLLMQAFLPRMLERGSGSIVSIGSVAGRVAYPGNGAYSAAKFGLRALHEVLEQELKGTGVRAILVEPSATDTALWDAVDRAQHPGLPERTGMLAPETVAACVLFALSQPADVAIKYLGVERS